MSEDISCLLKAANTENKKRIFKLQKSQVSFESKDTYFISSNDSSHLNAIFYRIGNTWTIQDAKSLYDTHVNGQKLTPFVPHKLQEGDLIKFDISTCPNVTAEFEYTFDSSLMDQVEADKAKSVVISELDDSEKENETAPLTQLMSQQEMLLKRTKMVQNGLQKKMKEALEAKKKEFEQQLLNQNMAFEMILRDKEREQTLLMQQINETKKEVEAAQLQVLRAKEDVISNFVELMAVNMQCSICREYLVKATALNCSHVFCKLCIKQWIKVKNICPNCRSPITSHIQIPAMDNCIDKMIDQLSDELKKRRSDFVKQRKIEQDEFECSESGNLSARNAFLRMRGGGMQVAAALRRAATHARTVAVKGAATFRRAAAHTQAVAHTRAKELTRSTVLRRAVALTRAAAFSGSQALQGAQSLTKSIFLRRAAAFTRAAARAGANTLKRSTVLERAVAILKAAVLRGSNVLTKSEITRKATTITKAVTDMLPRNPTVKKAVELTRATIKRAVIIERARAVREAIESMKTTALRNSAKVARTAAVIRASTFARIAALKNSEASTRRMPQIIPRIQATTTTEAVPSPASSTFTSTDCGWDRDGYSSFRSWNIALSFTIGTQ